jgi:hypothetical protein
MPLFFMEAGRRFEKIEKEQIARLVTCFVENKKSLDNLLKVFFSVMILEQPRHYSSLVVELT